MHYSEHIRFVFLGFLLVASALNLFTKHKNISKPLLLPLITAYYVASVQEINWILVAALAASWFGDVLLMLETNAWFTAGGISFMLSHFLFIAVYVARVDFLFVNWLAIIPAAIVYFTVSAVIIRLVKPTTPKMMVVPMYIYLLANSSMNIFALMQLLSNPCFGSVVAYIGAVLFFVSDCTLFVVRYYKNGYFKSFFLCMLTYILGELFIVQGIIMMS
ncbi:MAG: lysoplasmalogenase [Clostridia bacterium]|nr:lysoplasmalogenase [Clostridia bacterium]